MTKTNITSYELRDLTSASGKIIKASNNEKILSGKEKEKKNWKEEKKFIFNPLFANASGIYEENKRKEQEVVGVLVNKKIQEIESAVKEEGIKKGFEEGKKQIEEKMAEMLQEKVNQLSLFFEELFKKKDEIILQQKKEILDLIFLAVEWISFREISLPETYAKIIEKLLLEFQDETQIKVKVSEEFFETLQQNKLSVEQIFLKFKNISLEKNYEKTEDLVQIETENGIIKLNRDDQFSLLKKLFEEVEQQQLKI